MKREEVGGVTALLERIESARARELPGLVQQLTAFVRGNQRSSRRLLDEAEREAPHFQRRIEALRQAHDDLEDDLDRLDTGEVELSVLAAHLKYLEDRDAALLADVRYDDIGVGD